MKTIEVNLGIGMNMFFPEYIKIEVFGENNTETVFDGEIETKEKVKNKKRKPKNK